MPSNGNRALEASDARRRCAALPFETTNDVEPLDGLIGQSRAEEALRFGVGIRHKGYNVFVLGPPGTGKHHLVRDALRRRADPGQVPADQVYVHNFQRPDRPIAIALPAGRGAELEAAMNEVVRDLDDAILAMFESDDYRTRRRVIEQKVEARHEEAFAKLATRATEQGLRMLRTPAGLAFAPFVDGQVLEPDAFAKLPDEKQAEIRASLEEMENALREVMHQVPAWRREARDELREIEEDLTRLVARHQLERVRAGFADLDKVAAWLDAVEADVVQHVHAFLPSEDENDGNESVVQAALHEHMHPALRYRVNLFVDRRGLEGAPVIEEDHPTVERLFGRVDRRVHLGALISDFSMIKPGALHRANGGTLVVDARRLLGSPAAWDSLKRALTRREIEIESLGKELGMTTSELDPEPIPLDAKIILVGERQLYYVLASVDPDFDQLFKVAADFDDVMPWDEESQTGLTRLIAGIARADELLPFDAGAVARVVEQSARWAGDRRQLSAELSPLSNLLREADWKARDRGAEAVGAIDVRAAIAAREHRLGRLRERTLGRFTDGTLGVRTDGEVVGQVNGLSVLSVGELAFGQPSRITARVRVGGGDLVDIERQSDLGGKIHTKGVMILSSYLTSRYGAERPLSVSASLAFEQSYGGVDGDSASMAELCVLLSALSEIPIKQCFAITGSVDQNGRAQVIGGVNEKIEGFYDVCRERGLDGTHGALIPEANVEHLMLREDIVEAVAAGRFHLFHMACLDDALETLTGRSAEYVHEAVAARLASLTERMLAHEKGKRR
ncbi:MAG: AAA family ATPase [Sandaracinaceae bacterium]|nr:AAA family ATPase [Sandaracinaceae bacterium]